jgi:hypothetical protein
MNKLVKFFSLILVRAASMIAMSASLLFIWWQGSIEEVGIFSGITAVITPIVSLSHYRYVEYISTSKSKLLALSTAISSSVSTYIVISLIVVPIFIYIYGNTLTIALIWFYKLFELITDIYIAYLSVIGKEKTIKIMILQRLLLLVIGFSCLTVINNIYNINLLLYIAFLLCLVFTFSFLFDFRKVNFKYKFKDALNYTNDNIGYGLSSLTISINSLLPRYLYIYTGDNKTLGIYSIIYLLSANLVNLIQYPISIYATRFNDFVSKNKLKIITLSLTICFAISPILYVFESYNYIFYMFSMSLIFLSLLLRAMLITSLVVMNLKIKVLKVLVMSLSFSFIGIIIIRLSLGDSFRLEDGIFYTILSGCIAVLLSYYYKYNYKY